MFDEIKEETSDFVRKIKYRNTDSQKLKLDEFQSLTINTNTVSRKPIEVIHNHEDSIEYSSNMKKKSVIKVIFN